MAAAFAANATATFQTPDYVLLLHMDGTNGSTSFPDTSGLGNVVTASNATVTTASPALGTGAALFNGAITSNLQVPITAGGPLDLTGGDWTVEFWLKTPVGAQSFGVFGTLNASNTVGISLQVDLSGGFDGFVASTGGGHGLNGALHTIVSNTWQAIAIVRQGNVYTAYVGGISVATFTASDGVDASSGTWIIGACPNASPSHGVNGQIDEFRVTKGVALYTANYTPASAPFPDPVAWTHRTSAVTTDISPVRFGNGVFMGLTTNVAGDTAYVVRSTDGGVTWTQVLLTSGLVSFQAMNDLAYGAGVWIAVGGSTNPSLAPLVYRSTNDGLTWTHVTGLPALGSAAYPDPGSVGFQSGTWVVAVSTGSSTAGTDNYMVSTDGGLTWTLPNIFDCHYFGDQAIGVDGTNFNCACVDASNATKIATSADGRTWATVAAPTDFNFSQIAFGAGVYVSGNSSTATVRVAATLAGLASAADTPTGLASGSNWIQYGGGTFIAIDSDGGVASSPDGVSWTLELLNFPSGQLPFSVAYGSGVFVAAGSSGNISTLGALPPVTVPNVVGDALSVAEAAILAVGLTLGTVSTGTSITVLSGNIISQSPAAGSSVSAGSAVAMVESTGLPNVTVPNVVGNVLATGEAAIVAVGAIIGAVSAASSISVAAGHIVSQSITGSVIYGASVDLVNSTGLPTVPVPNVVGMPLATASATLVAAGFVPGTVTSTTSILVPGGSIISQSVTGTALYGTTVNMVESSGLPTVTVPNVVGDTVSAASAALVAANLVLGVVSTGHSPTIPAGEIMSQSVTGTALYGTPVDLVLSLGPPLIFPAVIGQNIVDATATLASEGLTLGTVIEGVSDVWPIGIIFAYSPPGGVPPGSTVDLFVSALYTSANGAKYAKLITSEHNQKPKYMALVSFLCSVMGDIAQATAAIPAAFDLDLAVGNQLDIIGLWVGQPRVIQSILLTGFFGFADDVEALPFGELTDSSKGGRWYELNEPSTGTATLGDSAYRTLLKARIIRNQSDGTEPEIAASLLDIFGVPCQVADLGTLSLAITVPVPITPEEQALVGPLDLLPRPAGVRIGSITYTP